MIKMKRMMRKILWAALTLVPTMLWAQTPTIQQAAGWLESAYVTWSPVSGADSYNVYYSGEGVNDQRIDDQLIRGYGSYMRADVLGLKAGNYTIRVAPVFGGSEGSSSTTSSLSVQAHDRSGFAFSNGRVPGAYKADGTPKDGAVILYITENTKNTISLDVTGANANPCVGLQTILEGFKKGQDNRPLIIRMVGQITDLDYMSKGDIVIENSNNDNGYITLEGVGDDAVADGWGIRVKNGNNIEIRNIGTMNCNSDEGDNIGLQQNNFYVWVHNVDFFYGDAGGDSDQAKGDGALDTKKSSYVTHSYNHFWDSGKANLLSNGGEDVGVFTYHHNWYDHSDSRHPRVRDHTVHVYNNYFDGISKYGIGATTASSIFSENNYFRNCNYPMLISEQGTDVYGENDGTFSGDPGGMIKAYGNYIEGAKRFVDQNEFPNDFDAYVVSSRNSTIPSSVSTVAGGNTYNNFDTGSSMYSYTPESAENARNTVMQYAGRMNGGDFSWTFNNAVDDTDSDVNAALKSAVSNYTTSLQYIQGDGDGPIITPSFNLTTSTSGSGSVNGGGTYDEGAAATLTAVADNGWEFVQWTGDASGSSTSVQVLMDADKSVTAVFQEIISDYTLTANIDGAGSVDGAGGYNNGETATITAIAAEGWEFVQWTGDASGTNATTTVSMNGNKTVTAVFEFTGEAADVYHDFTASGLNSDFFDISGNLSTSKGTVNYNGLTLTQCLKIESSTSIDFTSPAPGELTLVFNEGWSGGFNVDGVSQAVSGGILTMDIDAGSHTLTKDNTANLYYISLSYGGVDPVTQYTISATTNGNGSVSGGGTYDENSTIQLTATADSGYQFDGWSGDASGSSNPLSVLVDGDKSITANFSQIPVTQYTVSTSSNGNGSVTGGGTFDAGSVISLTASPNSGYQFDGWSGDASGSSNPLSVAVDGNKSISASFSVIPPDQYSLTSSVSGSGSISPASGTFDDGTSVSVTATPASGWQFDGWSGDLSGTSASATLIMNSNKHITAAFSEIPTGECTWVEYQAENGSMSSGSMDSNNSGFTGSGFANTDNTSGVWYEINVDVPSAGPHDVSVRFANGSSTDRAQQISVNGSTQISSQSFPGTGSWTTWTTTEFSLNLSAGTNTIRFTSLTSSGAANLDRIDVCQGGETQPVTYTLSASANGQGSVSGAGTYDEGSTVQLTATPGNGWQFDSWSGVDSSNGNTATVSMNADRSVTANFSQIPVTYSLSVNVSGQGSVNPSSGNYNEGTQVSITATPASGWQFDGWSNGSSDNPLSVTMSSNVSLTANFSEIPVQEVVTITIQENESGFCSVQGSVDSNNGGFTGSGFANTSNATGNGIDYSIDAAAGTATLVIRYANGSSNRPANVIVNGSTQVSSLNMPSTGSWTSWSTVSTTVTLADGSNSIRFEATASGGLVNFDYLEVTGYNVSGVSCGSGARTIASGVSDPDHEIASIAVYPNPVMDQLTLSTEHEIKAVEIYSVQGQLVYRVQPQFNTLDMSQLQSGYYMLKVMTTGGTSIQKIIKR